MTTVLRWVIYLSVSIVIALVAFLVNFSIHSADHGKSILITKSFEKCLTPENNCLWLPLIVWVAINATLTAASCLIVLLLQPEAGGGGTAPVKAFLNGIRMPGLFTFKALIAKMMGTVLSIAGGLPKGKEAPLIHLGAIVAAQLSNFSKIGRIEFKVKAFGSNILIVLKLFHQ